MKTEETPPGTVATEPVGHDGARVNIDEREVWSLGAGPAAIALVALLAVMIITIVGFVASINALESGTGGPGAVALLIASCVIFTIILVLLVTSIKVVSPGHTLTSTLR